MYALTLTQKWKSIWVIYVLTVTSVPHLRRNILELIQLPASQIVLLSTPPPDTNTYYKAFHKSTPFMHNIVLQQTRNICLPVTVLPCVIQCVGFAIHFHCDILYQIAESHLPSEEASITNRVWSSCCCNGLICGILGKTSRHILHSCVLVELSQKTKICFEELFIAILSLELYFWSRNKLIWI